MQLYKFRLTGFVTIEGKQVPAQPIEVHLPAHSPMHAVEQVFRRCDVQEMDAAGSVMTMECISAKSITP